MGALPPRQSTAHHDAPGDTRLADPPLLPSPQGAISLWAPHSGRQPSLPAPFKPPPPHEHCIVCWRKQCGLWVSYVPPALLLPLATGRAALGRPIAHNVLRPVCLAAVAQLVWPFDSSKVRTDTESPHIGCGEACCSWECPSALPHAGAPHTCARGSVMNLHYCLPSYAHSRAAEAKVESRYSEILWRPTCMCLLHTCPHAARALHCSTCGMRPPGQ